MAWNQCFTDLDSLKRTFDVKWKRSPFRAISLDGIIWCSLFNIFKNTTTATLQENFIEELKWYLSQMQKSLEEFKSFYKVSKTSSSIINSNVN